LDGESCRTVGCHPIFIGSGTDAAKNHASLRLAHSGADAMKAVAIVSAWISCTDETGEHRAIPKGTRIRIESRADGYLVSWRCTSRITTSWPAQYNDAGVDELGQYRTDRY
jgi:hypothetical protein